MKSELFQKITKRFFIFTLLWILLGFIIVPVSYAQDTVDVDGGKYIGSINLKIPKATNFWGADGGQGTIFSYIAMFYYAFSIIILIAFIIMEIWGGMIIMTSQWEQSKLDKGKTIMKNGFYGLIALLLIFGIVLVISAILNLGNPLKLASTLQSCGGVYGYESGLDTDSGSLTCNGETDTWCISQGGEDYENCSAGD